MASFKNKMTQHFVSQGRLDLYVDYINGNDLNDGTMENPLKSFTEALKRGNRGFNEVVINLHNDQQFDHTETVSIINQVITVRRYGDGTNKPYVLFKNYVYNSGGTDYNANYNIVLYNSSIQFYDLVLETEDEDPNVSGTSSSAVSLVGYLSASVRYTYCDITHNTSMGFLKSRDGNHTGVEIYVSSVTINDGAFVDTYVSNVSLGIYNTTINDDTKWVKNIVKDSNGIPRNVQSNLIL